MTDPGRCPYCDAAVQLVTYEDADWPLLGHPRPDGTGIESLWMCIPCWAWTRRAHHEYQPTNTVAVAVDRKRRRHAHRWLDEMWRTAPAFRRAAARVQAYRWLAGEMGVAEEECHIGLFTGDRLRQALTICIAANRRDGKRFT